mgnify:CR=1 FL=1
MLIDDVLALDAGGLTSSLSFPAQEKIRAILLTHYHFDHIRDIATLGLATALLGPTNVYSTPVVLEALSAHLINGEIYPKFTQWPSPERPSLLLCPMEPYRTVTIEGYNVVALPVNHTVPTVGYQVVANDKSALFYTGDTGPGLSSCWPYISPQLLIAEVSGSNRWEKRMREAGHLTPRLLKDELVEFRELKGYLPPVIAVHMNPSLESEIETEVAQVARELDSPVTLAYEGMRLHL